MWSEPKTDWKSGDAVVWTDYNRIKNNIEYLYEQTNLIIAPVINYEDMGPDKSYEDFYYADEFNKFENNLDRINDTVFPQDIGVKQTFYDNGAFISSAEINRLETGCQKIKYMLDQTEHQRIPFRLGNYKNIKL